MLLRLNHTRSEGSRTWKFLFLVNGCHPLVLSLQFAYFAIYSLKFCMLWSNWCNLGVVIVEEHTMCITWERLDSSFEFKLSLPTLDFHQQGVGYNLIFHGVLIYQTLNYFISWLAHDRPSTDFDLTYFSSNCVMYFRDTGDESFSFHIFQWSCIRMCV